MYRQKNGDISLKGFGAVKGEFIRLTNWLKTTQNKNIIYVFHTVEEKDKDGNIIQRLMCEGGSEEPCLAALRFGRVLFGCQREKGVGLYSLAGVFC